MIVAATSLAARWGAGWWLGARERRLAVPSEPPSVRVSIVIPARNEAVLLPRLLRSLRDQTLAPHEIVVVDDDSTDDTAAIAHAHGATVLTAGMRPPGWTGKTWACAQGAAATTGDLLLFLDADTVATPDLVAAVAAAHAAHGGIVSVAPYHRTERPYEQLSACFNLVAAMGIGSTSCARAPRITGAYGPCLAIGRADYERLGGHAAVADEVLDDVALARRARAVGLPVHADSGRGIVELRMYPDGVGSLVRGWTKNFAAGAGTTPLPRLLAIVAWISGLLEAGWWTVAGLASLPFGGTVSLLHLAFYGLFAIQCAVLLRRLGSFGTISLLHPVAVGAFLFVFVRSLVATARGRVEWKDREVPTRLRVGR